MTRAQNELTQLTKLAFRHFITVICESAIAQRRLTPDKWQQYIDFPDEEKVRALSKMGKGLIVLTPHLGNWEVSGSALALAGIPYSVIIKPLKNRRLDEYLRRRREALGAKTVPRRGGFRYLVAELKAGRTVALLPDQNQRKRPIFVDFFGKRAATDRSPAYLAMRFGAPVAIGFAKRVGWDFRFQIISRVLQPKPPSGNLEQDILTFAREINAAIEDLIRMAPEQYFWLHDRYRTRPPEERQAVQREENAPTTSKHN